MSSVRMSSPLQQTSNYQCILPLILFLREFSKVLLLPHKHTCRITCAVWVNAPTHRNDTSPIFTVSMVTVYNKDEYVGLLSSLWFASLPHLRHEDLYNTLWTYLSTQWVVVAQNPWNTVQKFTVHPFGRFHPNEICITDKKIFMQLFTLRLLSDIHNYWTDLWMLFYLHYGKCSRINKILLLLSNNVCTKL